MDILLTMALHCTQDVPFHKVSTTRISSIRMLLSSFSCIWTSLGSFRRFDHELTPLAVVRIHTGAKMKHSKARFIEIKCFIFYNMYLWKSATIIRSHMILRYSSIYHCCSFTPLSCTENCSRCAGSEVTLLRYCETELDTWEFYKCKLTDNLWSKIYVRSLISPG